MCCLEIHATWDFRWGAVNVVGNGPGLPYMYLLVVCVCVCVYVCVLYILCEGFLLGRCFFLCPRCPGNQELGVVMQEIVSSRMLFLLLSVP